jgi:hypothetical protein
MTLDYAIESHTLWHPNYLRAHTSPLIYPRCGDLPLNVPKLVHDLPPRTCQRVAKSTFRPIDRSFGRKIGHV